MTRLARIVPARLAGLVPLLLACATTPMNRSTPHRTAARADTTTQVPQVALLVPVESAAARAIDVEAMAGSRVAVDLQYLSDVIGPRLTTSAALRVANEWTMQKFREYGADSAWLEPWRFGRSWERGPMRLRMLSPQVRELHGASWAWAPGTNGPRAGDVVELDARTSAEFQTRFAGTLRGKWVMAGPSFPVPNPDGPPPTHADSASRAAARRALASPTPEQQAFQQLLPRALAAEQIAGFVRDGAKEFGLLTMSGSPSREYPYPYIVVAHETYTQFERLLRAGVTPRIEATIANTFGRDSTTIYNTVAEIRGSERPAEIVLLGAHLDSWDLGTGTTDNGTGAIAVLETARVLKATGVRPKRTIRFVLFGGEEQGLFGSKAYAAFHASELEKVQAVLVLDNGTGRISGVGLQARDELRDVWTSLFAAIAPTHGPFSVHSEFKTGTDHLSFLPYGVPAFNFDQVTRGYDHTHHSEVDTYDHALVEDLRQAAAVMATTAYELANMPARIPRGRTDLTTR